MDAADTGKPVAAGVTADRASFAAGVALVVSSAVAFGAMPVLASVAYAHGATPFTLLSTRFFVAWAALLAGARLARMPRAALTARQRLAALGLGAVGYASTALGFFASLRYVPAQVAALLFYTYPALVAAGSSLLRRRPLGPVEGLALVTALAGSALVVGGTLQGLDGRGVALALGAAVCYAGYIVAGDATVARLPAHEVARLVVAGALASSLLATMVAGDRFDGIAPAGWAAAGLLGLLSTAYAISAFLAGLARVGPTVASILSAGEPLVATALAVLVLGERLTPSRAVGAGLVVGAVVLVSLARAREKGTAAEKPVSAATRGGPDHDGASQS